MSCWTILILVTVETLDTIVLLDPVTTSDDIDPGHQDKNNAKTKTTTLNSDPGHWTIVSLDTTVTLDTIVTLNTIFTYLSHQSNILLFLFCIICIHLVFLCSFILPLLLFFALFDYF